MKSRLAIGALVATAGIAVAACAVWRMFCHVGPDHDDAAAFFASVPFTRSPSKTARDGAALHDTGADAPAIASVATHAQLAAPAPGANALPDALVRAIADPHPTHRVQAIATSLRQWAARDAEAASTWVLLHCPIPQSIAMAAVINGAVEQGPAVAERLATELSERDSDRAGEYGGFLISALGTAGEHSRAAAWALMGGGDSALDWTTAAYHRWGTHEPEAALLSAAAVADPLRRRAALDAAIGAWAQARPRALAECAVGFPPGPEKNLALVSALRAWAAADPDETANWIHAHREALAGLDRLETILEE